MAKIGKYGLPIEETPKVGKYGLPIEVPGKPVDKVPTSDPTPVRDFIGKAAGRIGDFGKANLKAHILTKLGIPGEQIGEIIGEEGMKDLATTVQIAGAFTGASPLAIGVGEVFKSTVGSPGDTLGALKKGGVSAGIDIAGQTLLGPLGPVKSLLSKVPGTKGALSEGLLPAAAKGIGKKLIKARTPQPKFSEEVVAKIQENPELSIDPKETLGAISRVGIEGVKSLRKTAGELIGTLKKKAGLDEIKVPLDNLKRNVKVAKEEAGFIDRPGIIRREDSVGESAINVIETQLSKKAPNTYDNAQVILDNIDSSKEFQLIFDKLNDPARSLTSGENLALKMRRDLSKGINSSVDELAEGLGLGQAKGEFSKLANMMDDPLLKNSLKNPDTFGSALTRSLKENRTELFSKLEVLDDLLPDDGKFLNKAIGKLVGREIGKVSDVFGNLGPSQLAKGAIASTGRALAIGGPKRRLIGTGARLGAQQLGNTVDDVFSGNRRSN